MMKRETLVAAMFLALVMGACLACTARGDVRSLDESEASRGNFVEQVLTDFKLLTMSPEEKQAFEDRAKLREQQRAEGLRACEEGEHGTKWREDCKVCQCEHGLRICPAVKCRHRPGERHLPPPNRR